jgi:cadmium resistance protein CadD (predicted permease)
MEVLATVALAVILFTSSNIDDIFVLLSFYADPRFGARQVVLGQYLGMAVLVAASTLASLLSWVLPMAYVGLLGLLPIGIGLRRLVALNDQSDSNEQRSRGRFGQTLTVTAVTIANGGDNIGIYTPVFATHSVTAIVVITVVFVLMVAVWLMFAHWLVNHPALRTPIRRFAHVGTPFVLIGIGVFVLYDSGSISLLR